jgi:hypothetical protein
MRDIMVRTMKVQATSGDQPHRVEQKWAVVTQRSRD